MDCLVIYTHKITPRVAYIIEFIFEQYLQVPQVILTDQVHIFETHLSSARLNYSKTPIANSLHFPNVDLLFQTGTSAPKPTFNLSSNRPAAFFHQSPHPSLLAFDLFALSFYLLSRYEEYQDFEADQHGRFSASESLAHHYHFLQRPLIDEWLWELHDLLKTAYPTLSMRLPQYQFYPSYDIDHAYAFRHKGLGRQVGALGRHLLQLDTNRLRQQLGTWMGLQADPYDCYDYLDSLHQRLNLTTRYFWLLGDYGTYDKNIAPNKAALQTLIQQHAQQYPLGIHPSYGSNASLDQLKKEVNRLANITKQTIDHSRQHFLKLSFPQTYEALLVAGIEVDYSMGYAAQLGFRASTAQAFFWYNLKTECSTKLKVVPFQVMDVSLNTYLNLAIDDCPAAYAPIISATKAVGGTLVSIWHNSSLCEAWQWHGWRKVYEQFLAAALVP